nr:hypothetical protein Iba_chr08eCG4860 [Ipomoea batatas]
MLFILSLLCNRSIPFGLVTLKKTLYLFAGNLELGLFHTAPLAVDFLVERLLWRACLLAVSWKHSPDLLERTLKRTRPYIIV